MVCVQWVLGSNLRRIATYPEVFMIFSVSPEEFWDSILEKPNHFLENPYLLIICSTIYNLSS